MERFLLGSFSDGRVAAPVETRARQEPVSLSEVSFNENRYRTALYTGKKKNPTLAKAGFTSKNKEKALTMFQGINDKDSILATKYVNPDSFVNHNHRAYDGVQGIQGFIGHLPPPSSAKVVRAFEDGPYVFTHSEGDVFGEKIFFDIFRFEDGLIVEHWDNITDRASSNARGHTQIDGDRK